MTNMVTFNLPGDAYQSGLTGTLPAGYQSWFNIVTIVLDNQALSGTLPDAWQAL